MPVLERSVEVGPQPGPQEMFLSTRADIAIYGGSAGGGKTYGLLLESIRHIHNPNFGGVIFRRNMKQVKQEGGIWDETNSVYPGLGAKPNLSECYWTFPSGAAIQFAGLEHETSKNDYAGSAICFLAFDELYHFTEGQFFFMLSRNRSTCGIRPYVRGTTNPTQGWLKRFLAPWVDRKYPNPAKSGEIRWFMRVSGKVVWLEEKPKREPCECRNQECENCFPPEKSVTFIRAKVYDNKILLEKNPEYVTNLKALGDTDRRQLLDGDWDVTPAHRVLDGFQESIHVVPWRKLPEHWRMRAIGGDFGSINAAEIFVAEDPDSEGPVRNLYVFDEDWPGYNRATKEIADTIRKKCGGTPLVGCGGNKTVEQGSVEAYKMHGIPMVLPEFRDVNVQFQCVNDEFRAMRLFVMDNCQLTIDMLNTFQRDLDDDGNPLDSYDDSNFHLLSCLRYIIAKLRPPKDVRFSGSVGGETRILTPERTPSPALFQARPDMSSTYRSD